MAIQRSYIAEHVTDLSMALRLVCAKHDPNSESIRTILCVAKSLENVASALECFSRSDVQPDPLPDLPVYPNGGNGGVKVPLPTPPPGGAGPVKLN